MKRISALFFLLASAAWAQVTYTPNVGLQIPATGSANWDQPLNFNFNRLDQLFGGNVIPPGSKVMLTPVFGSGAPAMACVVSLEGNLYFDTSSLPWNQYVCHSLTWHQAGGGGGGTFPAAGIPKSTGGGWGPSYNIHGNSTYVQLSDNTGTSGHVPTYDANGNLKDTYTPHGNGTFIQASDNTGTATHLAAFDASGNLTDGGPGTNVVTYTPAWNSLSNYVVGNLVTYSGMSFINILPVNSGIPAVAHVTSKANGTTATITGVTAGNVLIVQAIGTCNTCGSGTSASGVTDNHADTFTLVPGASADVNWLGAGYNGSRTFTTTAAVNGTYIFTLTGGSNTQSLVAWELVNVTSVVNSTAQNGNVGTTNIITTAGSFILVTWGGPLGAYGDTFTPHPGTTTTATSDSSTPGTVEIVGGYLSAGSPGTYTMGWDSVTPSGVNHSSMTVVALATTILNPQLDTLHWLPLGEGIGNTAIKLTGTPSTGMVPIAANGTTAGWGLPPSPTTTPMLTRTAQTNITRILSTAYQNVSNYPMIVAYGDTANVTAACYTDSTTNPTTLQYASKTFTGTAWQAVMCYVKPGDYYKITGGTWGYWNEYIFNAGFFQGSANLSGSRAINTVYQNVGQGFKIVVVALGSTASGDTITAYVDGNSAATQQVMTLTSEATNNSVFFIVPAGYYYRINRSGSGTITSWFELTTPHSAVQNVVTSSRSPSTIYTGSNFAGDNTMFITADWPRTGTGTGFMYSDPTGNTTGQWQQSNDNSGTPFHVQGFSMPGDKYSVKQDSATAVFTDFVEYTLSDVPNVNTLGAAVPGDIAAFAGAKTIISATATQVNTLIKSLTGCSTIGNVYSPQSGTCIVPASGSAPSASWSIATGVPVSPAAPYLLAATSGTVSHCYFTTLTSDGATALTFNVLFNSVNIISGTNATVAAATVAGTISTFNLTSGTISITSGQKWELDITAGTANWKGAVQCF